jgi:two-component system sensor histidine kinase DesK
MSGPGPEAEGLSGSPRLARVIVLAVLSAFAAVQAIDELTAPFRSRAEALTIGFTSLTVLFVLAVLITSPSVPRWPAWCRWATLLAEGVVTYLPLLFLFNEWAGMAGFFAGATLLLASGWVAWALFAAAVGSMFVLPLLENLGPYLVAYFTLSTLVIGLVVFGLARLSAIISYVHATRGELAQLAIIRERMRISRDLHDLLGYSLSAITLKAELSKRLVDVNPAQARDELAELLDISRQALADVRTVAHGYRSISLAKEAASVTSLLATASITASVEVNCGALDERADTVLATVLREAVTNVLRHSTAQTCRISANRVFDVIELRILNDGVPASAASSQHQGGIANLTARLEAIGGKLTTTVRDDGWFDLLAEAPSRAPTAGKGPLGPRRNTAGTGGQPSGVDVAISAERAQRAADQYVAVGKLGRGTGAKHHHQRCELVQPRRDLRGQRLHAVVEEGAQEQSRHADGGRAERQSARHVKRMADTPRREHRDADPPCFRAP